MSSTCIFLVIFLPGFLWKPTTKLFSELQRCQALGKRGKEMNLTAPPPSIEGIRSLSKLFAFTPFPCLVPLACCQNASVLLVRRSSEITAIYHTFCEPGNTLKNMSACSPTACSSSLLRLSLRQPGGGKVDGTWFGAL